MKDFSVEINPSHKLIVGLNKLRKEDPKLASMAVKQLFDTSMLAANLPLQTKDYVKRTFSMLDIMLEQKLESGEKVEEVKVERLDKE